MFKTGINAFIRRNLREVVENRLKKFKFIFWMVLIHLYHVIFFIRVVFKVPSQFQYKKYNWTVNDQGMFLYGVL